MFKDFSVIILYMVRDNIIFLLVRAEFCNIYSEKMTMLRVVFIFGEICFVTHKWQRNQDGDHDFVIKGN